MNRIPERFKESSVNPYLDTKTSIPITLINTINHDGTTLTTPFSLPATRCLHAAIIDTRMSSQSQPGQGTAASRTGSNGVVNGNMSMPSQTRVPDGAFGGGVGPPPPSGTMSQQNLNQIVSSHLSLFFFFPCFIPSTLGLFT